MTYRLCIVYQMDPRGLKVGGIETHVRMLLERAPADFEVMLVGVDAIGDLKPGTPTLVDIGTRRVSFLPVIHYPDDMAKDAAARLTNSLSLRFTLGLARHIAAIRRFASAADRPCSFELQRYEASWLPLALRRPFATIVHNEYRRDNKTDSLVKRFWAIHRASEACALRTATRIVCVNPAIRDLVGEAAPTALLKTDVMSVSVDTDVFRPQPFDCADGVLRLAYAGRLEEQKDPRLMFAVIAELARRLDGRVAFHYLGTSDPTRYPEFAAIDALTIRHGFQRSADVARILAHCHASILTSNFEGMPCFLLETLGCGRPMAAIRLPQFDPLVVAGRSGVLVERRDSQSASAGALADAIVALWDDIRAGRLDPAAIAAQAAPYSVDAQLPRLFDMHRAMQRTPGAKRPATGSPAAAR